MYIYVFSHLIYYFTGNLILSIWAMFILNPLMNSFFYGNGTDYETPNIPKSLEREYINDKRFLFPLYIYILADTLTQIWALFILSDNFQFESSLFQNKLDNPVKLFSFVFVWGYCLGIGGLAAHELIHKKHRIHKIVGTY